MPGNCPVSFLRPAMNSARAILNNRHSPCPGMPSHTYPLTAYLIKRPSGRLVDTRGQMITLRIGAKAVPPDTLAF